MTTIEYTCALLQINQQFSGSPLSEAQVFLVEISNAAGSRLVNSAFTFIQLLNLLSKILCYAAHSLVHKS